MRFVYAKYGGCKLFHAFGAKLLFMSLFILCLPTGCATALRAYQRPNIKHVSSLRKVLIFLFVTVTFQQMTKP
jgi:hypothetical protein